MFAMRMTNDRDQELLRSAVSDSAANLLSFLPSLGTGEVFAFGEGFALPTRLRFRELPAEMVPKSEVTVSEDYADIIDEKESSLTSIIARWRGSATRQKPLTKVAEDMRLKVETAVTPSLRRLPLV
jgi:DNA helicase HerA-like ATPase